MMESVDVAHGCAVPACAYGASFLLGNGHDLRGCAELAQEETLRYKRKAARRSRAPRR